MSSLKEGRFPCDLCLILFFGFSIILAEVPTTPIPTSSSTTPVAEEIKGNCSCGGFATTTPAITDAPLLSQMPGLTVKCDQEGRETCKSLCIALATTTKAKGPEILCNKLKTANELKLSAFYKICEEPWKYANMTADAPLCCDDSKVKECPLPQTTTTVTTEAPKPRVARSINRGELPNIFDFKF